MSRCYLLSLRCMAKEKQQQSRSGKSHFKIPSKYRLTFVNENKLTKVWSVRMSKKRIAISLIIILIAVVCVGAIIISFTPLRTLLPGYLKNTERREYLEANARIDSLLNVVALNNRYIDNLNNILAGEIDVDSLMIAPIDPQPLDTALLIGPSEQEKAFVAAYTAHEGFSIENATTVLPDAPAFVTPIREAILRPTGRPTAPAFEVTEDKVGIFAIARATVADTFDSPDRGVVLLLQHPDGYLSIYEGLKNVNFKAGDKVASGARIGTFVRDAGHDFGFTLMRDGTRLKPTEYIQF